MGKSKEIIPSNRGLGGIFYTKGKDMKTIYTSESVNKGHPDKTCDIIADSFLDEALRQDKNSQMAVECAIKDDLLMIYGEATTKAVMDYDGIAKKILREVGYKNDFRIIKTISQQSADIHQAVVKEKLMANDQGMVYGYATRETEEFMPLPILIAHKLMKIYESFRKKRSLDYFSDAKSQVSVQYDENGHIEKITTVLVSVSHGEHISNEQIKKDIYENVVKVVLKDYKQYVKEDLQLLINISGKFTIWGSFGDSGCVGRKIIVDTYGGIGRVGGGCFSSKNATKVDRSGAYFARYIAKSLVAGNLCDKCEIAVSFGIGLEKPINMNIDCFGTNKISLEKIYEIVERNFDFSLSAIIAELDLLKPIYKDTACYGHFGRKEFSWEKVKKLTKL